MCPRNRLLSHVAQDMAPFWFGAGCGQSAQILGLLGAFWRHISDLAAYLRHSVALEGMEGLFDVSKSSWKWSAPAIFVCLAVLNTF